MFNIGGGEILALIVVGMILVGPDRMPTMAADAARFLIKIKNMAQKVTNEIKDNLDLVMKICRLKTYIQKL
jgi:sec-independent protein translocase protein TatB